MPRSNQARQALFKVPPQPDIPLKEAVKRDLYFTYAEAAAYFRCTPYQIELWVKAGKLDFYQRPGQGRLIRAVDISAALKDGFMSAA